MIDIEQIENTLYRLMYVLNKRDECIKMWSLIRKYKGILRDAIKIKKDKFNKKDTLSCLTIAEFILRDYKNVDNEIYYELINAIYSNKDIARIVLDGYSNGGYSFLLMSLMNDNLKLTDSQKNFAVRETMNKIGTSRFNKIKGNFYNRVYKEKNNSNNDDNFSKKYNTLYNLNTKVAHGFGHFDIRYYILKNNNWTVEEKKKLVYDFFDDYEEYLEYFYEWENAIIYDNVNYKDSPMSLLSNDNLYNYSYDELLDFYQDKDTTDRIWKKIDFCKLILSLRTVKDKCELLNNNTLTLTKKI